MKRLLLSSFALLATACQAGAGDAPLAAPATPPAIQAPAGLRLVLQAEAKGDQIYTCAPAAGAFAWKLEGPDAELTDAQGKPVGKHYAGPTWEAVDGSKVVAEVKEKADAPDPEAIPWLLLEAKSNAGAGVLSTVKAVQRVDTHGGKAPRDGCDAAHAGAKARVGYRARYAFYAP